MLRIKPMTQLSRVFCTFLRCAAFLQVIVAINIWLKLYGPVIFDPYRTVYEINRHGLCQDNSAAGPLSNRGEQTVTGQNAAQYVFSQFGRFFHPYTAMAERPRGFGKQGAGWGVVEIHLEAVGKHKFDIPQGIFRSWLLTQTIGKIFFADFPPVNTVGSHFVWAI